MLAGSLENYDSLTIGRAVSCCAVSFIILWRQVNLVLDDAVEYTPDPDDKTKMIKTVLNTEILLNGNQIAALVPGGLGPPPETISSTTSSN